MEKLEEIIDLLESDISDIEEMMKDETDLERRKIYLNMIEGIIFSINNIRFKIKSE